MFLPTSSGMLALTAILAIVLLGLWPFVTRRTGKGWRHELALYDILAGALAAVALAAFTLGTLNSSELTAFDNLSIVGYRKVAFALAGGILAGAGVLLMFNAGSWTSYAATFLTGSGLAMAAQAIRSSLTLQRNLLWGMAALGFCAAAAGIAALFLQGGAVPGRTPPPVSNDPRQRRARPPRRLTGPLASLFAVLAGLLIGVSPFLINEARSGEIGLGPYFVALGFAAGAFAVGLLLNPFLLNFPIAGDAIVVRDYFRKGSHLWGVAAGVLLGLGWLTMLIVWATPLPLHDVRWEWAARFGPALLTALLSLVLGEAGRVPKARVPLLAAMALFAGALGLGIAAL